MNYLFCKKGKKTWDFIARGLDFFPPQIENLIFYPSGNFYIDDFFIELYLFPGHSPGSCLLKINQLVFTGDSVLKKDIGRSDLIGGDKKSLNFVYKKYATV